MTVQDFLTILETQTALFEQLAHQQINLREAVYVKDYVLADASMSAMKDLSEAIRQMERQRQHAFDVLLDQLNIQPEFGLTMLFASLEGELREQLADAFRQLKVAVLQVRTVNEGILAYSGSQMDTMESIIDGLYPRRRSGTYTAAGLRQKTSEPLVLDHSM